MASARVRSFLFASTCGIATLAACATESPRLAAPQIEDSFELSGKAFTTRQHGQVVIKREALGKAFMVLPTLYGGGRTPQVQLLAPRVVSFELQGQSLAMLQRNLQAVYSELPSEELLQTFEVTETSATSVTFNWSMGLQTLPADRGWHPWDMPGAVRAATQPPVMLKLRNVFLRSVQPVDNGLELEQVAQVDSANVTLLDEPLPRDSSVTLRARIVPYLPNPRFEPRVSTRQQGVGYFEVAQTVRGSAVLQPLAMRWDTHPDAGPITYRISRHTPAHLVQAVAEGILYWNRVAGRELVQVEFDANPKAPMHDREVMVHWVSWNNGPRALAGLQADPTTGEILRGSLYVPASLAGVAVPAKPAESPGAAAAPLGAQGFASGQLCDQLKPPPALPSSLALHLQQDPSLQNRAAADHLRLIVAHETGHTLGLRHNFAASLGSTVPDAAHLRMELAAYLTRTDHGGAATASSVMDYLGTSETLLLGAAIRRQVLPYDAAALQWGYGRVAVSVADLQAPPFCTDYQAQQPVLGCASGDSGPHPLANYASQLEQERLQLGSQLARMGLAAAGPMRQAMAQTLAENAAPASLETTGGRIFAHLSLDASVLEVDSRLGTDRLVDPAAYDAATGAALKAAAEQVGGLPGLLQAAYPMDAHHAPRTGWLAREVVAELGRLGLPKQAFDAAETSFVQGYAQTEQLLLESALLSLTGAKTADSEPPGATAEAEQGVKRLPEPAFYEGVASATWEPVLAEMTRHILLDTTGGGTLPRPRFAQKTRVAATRLLSEQLFGIPGWAREPRAQLLQALEQRRNSAQQGTQAAAELRQWLSNEDKIIEALKQLNR